LALRCASESTLRPGRSVWPLEPRGAAGGSGSGERRPPPPNGFDTSFIRLAQALKRGSSGPCRSFDANLVPQQHQLRCHFPLSRSGFRPGLIARLSSQPKTTYEALWSLAHCWPVLQNRRRHGRPLVQPPSRAPPHQTLGRRPEPLGGPAWPAESLADPHALAAKGGGPRAATQHPRRGASRL